MWITTGFLLKYEGSRAVFVCSHIADAMTAARTHFKDDSISFFPTDVPGEYEIRAIRSGFEAVVGKAVRL